MTEDASAVERAGDPAPPREDMTVAEQVADPIPPAEDAGDAAAGKRKRGFPSPLTILVAVTVGVWLLALAIPSGQYQIDDGGRPIPGSYQEIDSPLDFGESVQDLVYAPINGLYGIQDLDTGQVGPFNRGALFGSAQVFLFILAIGGFMTVVFKTGALDLGIAHLAHKYKTRGTVLIVTLSVLFGILGSVMSWSDETLGFYALIIPLMLSLGYDRIVTVSVVTIAPFVGSIGSTVNPFRIGVGSDAAGVEIGDGIVLRLLLFVLTLGATIAYTVRYANRVKANPELSIVPHDPEDAELVKQAERNDLAPLSVTDKAVIGIVAFTFLLLVFSIIPWGSILNNTIVDPLTHETITQAFSWELGWWLPELTAMFVVMAIVIGLVARLGEAGTSKAFLQGVIDFTGPAILVAVARGVSVILTNTKTIDTVLNSMEGIVDGRSNVVFILLLSLISLPLGFLVGSGSAGMALVMPILAPLGDFAGVERSLIVTTYNAMGGLLLLVIPTNALLIAGLGLARVGFDKYFKFLLPLVGILTAIVLGVLVLGAVAS
ncbi:MAG: hypothetical protein WAS51_11880 [Ilumatobacteraceae bacterium]|nr:MAG: YfcC family protein [Actinomycetota bacterium]